MNETKVLLKIIKSFLEKIEDENYENVNEEQLYELARKHKVSNFLIHWARKACQSEEIRNAIEEDFHAQIWKDTNENLELENILNQWEDAGIKTLVFKGVIMKNIYPQSYMRQMCDFDLLVQKDYFKEGMHSLKALGYEKLEDSEHHLVLKKQPFMIVELHRKLIVGEEIGYEYFNHRIWDFVIPYQNYENIYQMTIEDAYIFCITHLIRHFKAVGICIRDILDVYLYYEKYKDALNEDKLKQRLEEFGCKEFEEKIRQIAFKWFDTKEFCDFDEVEQFILKGVSQDNHIYYSIGEKKGRWNYVMRLLFPEYKVIKERYPVLKKVPILLPFAWGIRILTDVVSTKSTVKARLNTVKFIQEAEQDEVENIQNIYEKLGIIRKEN